MMGLPFCPLLLEITWLYPDWQNLEMSQNHCILSSTQYSPRQNNLQRGARVYFRQDSKSAVRT